MLEGNELIEGEIIEPVDLRVLETLDILDDYKEGRTNNLLILVPCGNWRKFMDMRTGI